MKADEAKNRRVGLWLTLVILVIMIYSLSVVISKGRAPKPNAVTAETR
jgi:hypothetical protein